MSANVADFLLERLRDWGVGRVYGYPGDGINAIIGAFRRAGNDPELIQVRHEEMAAFMACGHAKFTGEVGVCLATSGPGAIHLLNGLYDAKLDHQPVVAIVGQQARARARRQLPAGGRPRLAVQGRRARVRRDGDRAGSDPPPGRPGGADRARPAHRDVHHHPQRPRLDGRRRDAAHAHGTIHSSIGYSRSRHRAVGGRPAAGRRHPERRREGCDAGRRGRPRRRRRRWSRSPRRSARASQRRCSARRRFPTNCRS